MVDSGINQKHYYLNIKFKIKSKVPDIFRDTF